MNEFVDNDRRIENRKWERIRSIFEDAQNYTARDWPRSRSESVGRANPYKFCWASEPIREQTLQMLCSGSGQKTDYPAKDVLRQLLYRWRVAQRRTHLQLPALVGYRWIWVSQADLSGVLRMDKTQLRDVMARLDKRGLVVRVYEPGRMGGNRGVTHYRPSNDLFRLCLKVTQFSDPTFLQATDDHFNKPTKLELRNWRSLVEHAFKFHGEELAETIASFVQSDAIDRAAAMVQGIGEVMENAIDETGMRVDEYAEQMAGYYEDEEG
jgi:hypothetical protein